MGADNDCTDTLDPRPSTRRRVHRHFSAAPELITEGDTISECLVNVEDAFAVVLEIYEDEGRPLPEGICMDDANSPVSIETIISVP